MAQQNATINGTLIFTGTFAGQASLQAQPIGGNLIFQLPNQLPTVNQILSVESVVGSVVTIGFAASSSAPSFSSITGSLALSQIAQGGATSGQALEWNGSAWAPATLSGAGVSSVFTRTGAVVALAGDYSAFYDALGAASTALTSANTFTTAA